MIKQDQRGLTLIEILLALAITGLLMSAIMFGRDNLRSRVVFSRNVDKLVNLFTTARSGRNFFEEGNPTVSLVSGMVGNTLLGYSIQMTNTDPTTNNLFGVISGPTYYFTGTGEVLCISCGQSFTTMNVAPTAPFIITFGITQTGERVVYVFDGATLPTNAYDTTQYRPIETDFNFEVRDARGNSAIITVDPQGNISRVIQ